MGVGAAAGRLGTSAVVGGGMHGVSEARDANNADAVRLADELARKIGEFAVAQGWIAPGAVR